MGKFQKTGEMSVQLQCLEKFKGTAQRPAHQPVCLRGFVVSFFLDRLVGLVDKGKCTNIANLDFLETFCLLLHDIWIKKCML